MVATPIEQLKRDYTDKYVKVDASRPELARFHDLVGQVKTVNMSRRALVEFLDYHLNIAWYDIDLSCLTVVEKPSEEALAAKKAEGKKPPDKPVAKAAPTTGEKQSADAAAPAVAGTKAGGSTAKPAAGGAKLSVADMLAAARGGGGAAAKPAAPAAPKAKAAGAPATPAAKPAAPAAKPAGGKLSVAEMLAAARGGAGAAPAAKAPAPATPAEEPAAEEEPAAAPVASAPAPAKAAAPKAAGGRVDRSTMSVADMIAYCREHDAA